MGKTVLRRRKGRQLVTAWGLGKTMHIHRIIISSDFINKEGMMSLSSLFMEVSQIT